MTVLPWLAFRGAIDGAGWRNLLPNGATLRQSVGWPRTSLQLLDVVNAEGDAHLKMSWDFTTAYIGTGKHSLATGLWRRE